MSPACVRAAVVWAFLAAAPLLVAGFTGASRLEDCFSVTLLGVAIGLPLLWTVTGQERGGPWVRLAELLLFLSASLPALGLAWSFSAVQSSAAAACVAYVVLLLLVLGAFLVWGPPRARSARIALVAALVAGLPLVEQVWGDVLGTAPEIGALLPPGSVTALLDPPSPGKPTLTSARAADGVRPVVRSVRPLLGSHVRPGEPYPLTVALGEGAARIAARSCGHRFEVPAGVGQVGIAATPLGAGYRVELQFLGPDGWSRLEADLPDPRVLPEQTLLIGTLGPDAPRLATGLLDSVPSVQVALRVEDLRLLALAGEAFDTVVVDTGQVDANGAASLRAWAAAGGVLVLADGSDLLRIAGDGDAAARGQRGRWDLRPLGAGLLVGPGSPGPLDVGADAPLRDRLGSRSRRRARRVAVRDSVLSAPAPRPSEALGRRAGLGALAVALTLSILALLRGRVAPATFLSGAAVVSLSLTLLLRGVASPSGLTYTTSFQVLEVPAGARVARRLEYVVAAAPRPSEGHLTFDGWAPPRPVFETGLEAVRSEGSFVLPADRANPEVRLPLGTPRTIARLDAVPLSGVFRITGSGGGQRIRIENQTEDPLVEAFALVRGGLYRVPDLAPGATVDLDLRHPPIPFARWRLSALDRSDAHWRRLVTAALTGRDLRTSLVLVGKGAAQHRVRSGAAEENAERPLVIVTATPETQ